MAIVKRSFKLNSELTLGFLPLYNPQDHDFVFSFKVIHLRGKGVTEQEDPQKV